MGKISNLRKPTVFVFNPSTELVTTNTVTPDQLTLGQVGIHRGDTMVGTGTGPTPTSTPKIEIHQNLGDNRFGTIRTKPIHNARVRGWHAVKAQAAVAQVSYIGYDEVNNTKQLSAVVGQEIIVNIVVYNNDLQRWYGPNNGYTHRIVYPPSLCTPCVTDCTAVDQDALADYLIAEINGTNFPAGSFPTQVELKNYMTASKVTTGTQGQPDYRVGVKLTGVAYTPQLLQNCNPQQFFKPNLTTFGIAVPQNCPNFPITYTTKAAAGSGWPAQVAELEMESQGYDRVRETFEDPKYMLTNYILRAQDGVKYDFYYLEYDWSHTNATPIQSAETKDPYIAIFAVPTTTGANLQTVLNAWLTPLGFAAITIAASTGKGTAPHLINS